MQVTLTFTKSRAIAANVTAIKVNLKTNNERDNVSFMKKART
jgi:hypothetical protein